MSQGRTFVRRRGMTPLPNRTVYDDRLSYAALGLLAVMLARPDGSPLGYRALMGRGLGQAATLRALGELDAAGYRHQVRRTTAAGRIVTDTVVSEEPITAEEAEEWLCGQALTVRGTPTRGAIRGNVASAQVAPRVGSPWHGQPRHGQATHSPTGSKVTTSLRSESPGDTNCPHGDPKGRALTRAGTWRCALCRREYPPPDHTPPSPDVDPRARAAGQHLEATA